MTATRPHRSIGWSIFRWGLLALVGLGALVLVACGGGDDANTVHPSVGSASSGANGRAPLFGGQAEESADAASPPGDRDGGYAQSPGVPGASGASGVDLLQGTLDRTIIRNGAVYLEVESVAQSFERVREVAEAAGGFVAESSLHGAGEDQVGSLTIRIPAERFGEVVAELQGIAVEVLSSTSSSQDVTEEFTDLEATVRNLRAVEQQYLTLLGQAEDIEDILLVQDRLNRVRLDLDRVQGRLNLLGNLASLATLRVTLQPTEAVLALAGPAEPGFGDRIADAWASSLEAIETVATAVAVAVVWSWWLIPVLAVLAFFVRRSVMRRPATPSARVDTPEGAA
ncbi:MAG: DUF4349 domain-containing protein [Dehalococcoidia bacterium]|nr:DUF4349 domain-containing protein [Dehalococcoidia bacterium]